MSYVTPNSTVQLFKGVPLNKDGEDTLYFANRTAQNTYFSGFSGLTFNFSNYSYIRDHSNGGVIRVGVSDLSQWNDLVHVNYLRFLNHSHEDKWYYAFVTKVDYVDEGRCDVTYEIDEMQSWLPGEDYELTECRIVRQHQTGSDNIGDNLQPENIQAIDYSPKITGRPGGVPQYFEELDMYENGYWIAVMLPNKPEGNDLFYHDSAHPSTPLIGDSWSWFPGVQTIDNTPCQDFICLFDASIASDMDDLGYLYSTWGKFVLNSWVIPKDFLPGNSSFISSDWCLSSGSDYSSAINTLSVKSLTYLTYDSTNQYYAPTGPISCVDVLKVFTADFTYLPDLSTYEVKNKKVFTNPYCYYEITAPNGQKQVLSFEKMLASHIDSGLVDHKPYVKIIGSLLNTTVSLIPYAYDEQKYMYDKQLGLQAAPTGSIHGSIDTKNDSAILSSLVQLGITGVGAVVGGPAGAAIGGIAGSAGMVVNTATQTQGSGGVFNLNQLGLWGHDMRKFTGVFQYTINYKEIDEYFDAYGYTQNKFDVPNISGRMLWTFIQTDNAHFKSVKTPAEALKKICDKYDKGVRFHKNDYTIGHLNSYTNAIV